MRKRFQITEYCQNFMKDYIGEGDLCIDATAGNGGDTEFLCRMVGESGRVCAFDIQDAALEYTKERLEKSGLAERAVLIRDGHERMGYYVKEEVAAIMFNFGYLPGSGSCGRDKSRNESGGDPVRYGIVESRRRDESLHLQRRRHRIRGADCAAWFFKNVGSKAVACTCA